MTESPRNTRPAPWAPPKMPTSPAPVPPAPRTQPSPTARTLPTRAAQRPAQRPGHASKIITAGLSTSLVLGIVSYLGNAAQAQAHQQTQAPGQAAVPVVQAPTVSVPTTNGTTPVVVGTPTVSPTVGATPQVIAVAVPAAPPPVAAAPQPVAVPVPAVTTSGTTKTSG